MHISARDGTVAGRHDAFARDVRSGLGTPGQKTLPCRYFYDDVGSALFEAITLLPEYGLTRADERLIRRFAPQIANALPGPRFIVELGSGSGSKTRHLLQACGRSLYYPIDVSTGALAICKAVLESVAAVYPVEDEYLQGLAQVVRRRKPGARALVLFLGSTLGNFSNTEAQSFLRALGSLLEPGDALLLGVDLVKPVGQLLAAYGDPTGVTAAFNLNLLARINRELGGDFDLANFRHEPRYDSSVHRVESHLVSRRRQQVNIAAAGLSVTLEEGESIWTESSYKFQRPQLRQMAHAAGFEVVAEWIDAEWPFVENLWVYGSGRSGTS